MKISDLIGEDLALFVAYASQYTVYDDGTGLQWVSDNGKSLGYIGSYTGGLKFRPHEDWSQGGPIIERERQSFDACTGLTGWYARSRHAPCDGDQFYGETMLIAAMRAYVASKFGTEVPDQT